MQDSESPKPFGDCGVMALPHAHVCNGDCPLFSAYVLQVLSYVFVPAGVVYIALMNLGNMGWCMRQLMLIGLSPYELM